ncbi:MAG: [protein-PII] uridylyltransferase [Aquincola sp.]|nr:[protein-PII] uridylyltransferase [Aquincola sp.]MDH4290365.1 [protein-PII] uridylyltransferase [Aquincola sp.]MDH5330772.1 [protein-PII] uridylyltransferase [Aquincola sp.]
MSAVVQGTAPAGSGIARLRLQHAADKNALLEAFAASRPSAQAAVALIRGLSRLADSTLGELWITSLMPSGAALVAAGGYGRGELFPYSDVDVLVLLPDGTDAESVRPAVERFITACWDIGLEIGSSVRTLEQCAFEAARDVTVQTALLECRHVTGARRPFVALRQRLAQEMDPRAFLRAKTLEMRQRHTKYEDTPYSLEPNCKESPGGLRDLQILLWVARAAGLGRTWAELASKGLATAFEVKQLQRNEGALKMIRARLHALAGRREDRLVFDLQTAVAESFGYRARRGQRVSELLMRRYYWAAKAVVQLNQILLLNIEERILGSEALPMRPINDRFFDRGGMIEVASDDLYKRDPHAILETFLIYQQAVGLKGLSARTLRALYNARNLMNGAFRRDPVNRARFVEILRQPEGQTHALRWMNDTSVLGRYLWVFRRIVGQMQHDLFHVYTVDQHILMVVRNVRRFLVPEHGHEYPFCSQLAAQFERPYVLFVAALFHDVAKGRGGDHSLLGSAEVRRFCRDHAIEGEDAKLIEFLVRHHLTMSHVAQKEDLSDPEVIAAFAAQVCDARTLTALYLLTVADIRGTSPKVWNAWKGKLLEDLYRLTVRALGGAQPSVEAELAHRKTEAQSLLALTSQLPDTEKPLWDTLDVGYFMRHDPADIAWHARVLWRHVKTTTPVVVARVSPLGEGLQVLVYSPDVPDLFARICGYFDNAGFSVHDAKVHTSRSGYGLDTFQVVHPQVDPDDSSAYRDLIKLVETQLTQTLANAGPLPEPRRGRVSRRVRSFPITPRVTLRPDERAQRWILSVSASDRSGLLYGIARVLARHHINLQLAKISTLGERVEDTFLVDGAELQHNRAQLAIESELLDALAPVAA